MCFSFEVSCGSGRRTLWLIAEVGRGVIRAGDLQRIFVISEQSLLKDTDSICKNRKHKMIGDLCWSTELLYVFFSLNVSNGLVRTMGNVLRSTRRTVTCAFARKDTQGNIVKRVKHNLVYIYTETASNLTEGVIL